MPHNWDRRTVLKAAAAALGSGLGAAAARAQVVPWSGGMERPKLQAPANAADCHHHIYDHRFPVAPTAVLRPPDALVPEYKLLQQRLGTTRNVVVQPSTYGIDNRCMLDALAQFGPTARGVAVVNTGVTDAELQKMHEQGVRGIRFNLVQAGATSLEMLEPLAGRVHDLGWHVQLHMLADQIAGIEDLLHRVLAPIVFDHMARIPGDAGVKHPAFRVVSGLIEDGRAWVKLSGAYMDSRVGPPSYADRGAIAKGFISVAAERCLWGTDWPHPTEKVKPDDAHLLDLLADWAPEETIRDRILVDNPALLYGFKASPT
ncbi:MAG: amidohydrolase family protein [Alphaproteobacteria bacterium]|nr:amidohydrolase family protein [Alphaproteobacteria bacterium]